VLFRSPDKPDAGQDGDGSRRPPGGDQADAAENPQDEDAGGKGRKPGEWDRLASRGDEGDKAERMSKALGAWVVEA
jgi:hypothetical protein